MVIGHYNVFSFNCCIWPNEDPTQPGFVKIGDGNYFNSNVILDSCGKIEIGNDNMFGPNVFVTDSNHSFDHLVSPKMLKMRTGITRIEDNCWIGASAVILSGVTIGSNSVIGAGSVVTKNIPSGVVAVGIPAKIIRKV